MANIYHKYVLWQKQILHLAYANNSIVKANPSSCKYFLAINKQTKQSENTQIV